MQTDGGGYTHLAVKDGLATRRSTDANDCKALGLDMVVPRTEAHLASMVAHFGAEYFKVIPGISKPTGGGRDSL